MHMTTKIINQHFHVPLSYPVHFVRNVFEQDCDLLRSVLTTPPGQTRKVFVVMDEGVHRAFSQLSGQLCTWFAKRSEHLDLVRPPEIVPGGEVLKNDYRKIMSLVDQMLEYHLDRHSYVLVIGGGAVLDAVGFAASLVHRGLRLIRMPSTTLAQNDAGIGVKNGMNLHGGKNTIGVFAAPYAVINDASLLDGLSDADWRDGISEAFKVAMIKDPDFFSELCSLAPALGKRDAAAMERLIHRCAELHLHHIATSGDPFELGSARPLDFGHWSAHKLESMSNFRITHGHAVAIGIALDALYATRLNLIPKSDADALIQALLHCGFDLCPEEIFLRQGDGRLQLLQGLDEFREHLGGELTLSLPSPVGKIEEIHDVKESWIEEHLLHLRNIPCA
jgi:3-dehydroquinate synthase